MKMVSPNRSRSPKSQMEMMMSHDGCVAGARLGYGRLLWLISAIALAWTGSLSAQDFWVDLEKAEQLLPYISIAMLEEATHGVCPDCYFTFLSGMRTVRV